MSLNKGEPLNKEEIATLVSVDAKVSKELCITVIDSFLENLKKSIYSGKRVKLRGFGSFLQGKKLRKSKEICVVDFVPSCLMKKEG